MPIIESRGSASARGFGLFSTNAPIATLKTYTFPAGTSTFTVPAGTTSLVSVTGKGADGSSSGSMGLGSLGNIITTTSGGGFSTSTQDWSNLWAIANSIVAIGSGGTSSSYKYTGSYRYYYLSHVDDVTNYFSDMGSFSHDLYCYGTPTVSVGYGAPLSGLITANYLNSIGGVSVISIYTPNVIGGGGDGASTTGFGLTFSGGGSSGTFPYITGYPAPGPTTYNNVAVTPGATYTVVNSNSLTITYYAT